MGSSGLELQHNKGAEILSKIVIVVVIGLLTLFFKVKKARIFIYLTVLAMTIGALFGPPMYVVMEGYDFELAVTNEAQPVPFNFAWRVPALNPLSQTGAELGLYRQDTDSFLKMNAQEIAPSSRPFLAQAVLPFYLPGNTILLYMWWWIFPAVVLGYWLLRKYLLRRANPTQQLNLKQALAHARGIDTVAAYEQVLNRCYQRRLWKPRTIIKQAHAARDAVFYRYHQRVELLHKMSAVAIAEAKRQEQNAFALSRYDGVFTLLAYALKQRQLSTQSHLPIDVRLDKDWWIKQEEPGLPLGQPRIADIESIEQARLANLWRSKVTKEVTLDQLRDNCWIDKQDFLAFMSTLVNKGEVPLVHATAKEFMQYVTKSLANAGVTYSTTQEDFERLVNQYFYLQFFVRVQADRNAKSYQRAFEHDLPGVVAQVLSLFFPDETLHSTGQPLFSGAAPNAPVPCVFNIHLFPKGRRMNGFPMVTASIWVQLHDEVILARDDLPGMCANSSTAINGDIGKLDAAAVISHAFSSPQGVNPAAAEQAKQLESTDLQRILNELDDVAKEWVKGNAEDIALDLLTDFWRSDESAVLMQFDAVLHAAIKDNNEHIISMIESLAASGASLFGVDEE